MTHFALEYAKHVNEILHTNLISTWFYKLEIYEVPDLCTALLITYNEQDTDQFDIFSPINWDGFLERMSRIKPDWLNFSQKNMQGFAEKPDKAMGGWEGRTIYFIRGGSNPEYWRPERAKQDVINLLLASAKIQGSILHEEANRIKDGILRGREHYRVYEDFVRVSINYLFNGSLGEAKAQDRTEPGNEGTEIRDLISQNFSETGFWKDLKDKYSCSEILFEAKNKDVISRDDIRQVYCYLKPAIGLWGFIVCRCEQPEKIHAYNRTLFKNFVQTRGVLILYDDNIRSMIELKMRGRDPSEYLRNKMSKFIRSI